MLMKCVIYSAEEVNGIQHIRSALIEHNDPYPKNVLIVLGSVERVMWIDFDVAITYPDRTYIKDRERGWIEFETMRVIMGYTLRSEAGSRTKHKILLEWFIAPLNLQQEEEVESLNNSLLLGHLFTPPTSQDTKAQEGPTASHGIAPVTNMLASDSLGNSDYWAIIAYRF
ncbi:hypothetical protein FQN57_003000 [Myotisia sp. PD_48]|nr:hypothetical protein FQN57_003000 [Myotisia sp. PD_48]